MGEDDQSVGMVEALEETDNDWRCVDGKKGEVTLTAGLVCVEGDFVEKNGRFDGALKKTGWQKSYITLIMAHGHQWVLSGNFTVDSLTFGYASRPNRKSLIYFRSGLL